MNPKLVSLNLNRCDITDAGVAVISRYCSDLREIRLSECHSITNLGLRSLSMKCNQMSLVDFTNCSRLDDKALRVIAASLESLQYLILSGCKQITDMGMREVAHCCTKLAQLDLQNCERIGKFGNYALYELGEHCHELETLDMRGCPHVSDSGLRALGRGCTRLFELHLSNCTKLSGSPLLELASTCKQLKILSVVGCEKITDADICVLASSCNQVRTLDLSNSNLATNGMASIARHCEKLRELRISRCPFIDNSGVDALTKGKADIHKLDVSHCKLITEQGIKGLVPIGPTGLSHLDLSGCHRIKKAFVYNMAPSFHFSIVSDSFLGFCPKVEEATLRIKANVTEINTKAAINMQRCTRGWIARAGEVKLRKIDWAAAHKLPHVQACIRGSIQRRAFQDAVLEKRQKKASTQIAAAWRGLKSRRSVQLMIASKLELKQKEILAGVAQRIYRGHQGRVASRMIRLAATRKILEVAKQQARWLKAAEVIQRFMRGAQSRVLLQYLKRKLSEEKKMELDRWQSALLLQRIFRGMQGRVLVKLVRQDREAFEVQWYLVREVQRVWRGLGGRALAKVQEQKIRERHRQKAATKIQRLWRGYKTRDKIAIAQSIERMRKREQLSALTLQRIYRGKQGQQKAEEVRTRLKEEQSRLQAAALIQRCFRGYNGRTLFHVLKLAMEKIRPLRAEIIQRKRELDGLRNELISAADNLAVSQRNTTMLEKEVAVVQKTKSKYWDSDQVTGTPQRFLTELLKVRLKEKLVAMHASTECIAAQYEALKSRERDLMRKIQDTEKKLDSLQQGPNRSCLG